VAHLNQSLEQQLEQLLAWEKKDQEILALRQQLEQLDQQLEQLLHLNQSLEQQLEQQLEQEAESQPT